MGYALRRSRLLVWSWQLCRGMSGNFRVEPVAILPWNQWQFLHGISGNFQMESVATFAWNTQASPRHATTSPNAPDPTAPTCLPAGAASVVQASRHRAI